MQIAPGRICRRLEADGPRLLYIVIAARHSVIPTPNTANRPFHTNNVAGNVIGVPVSVLDDVVYVCIRWPCFHGNPRLTVRAIACRHRCAKARVCSSLLAVCITAAVPETARCNIAACLLVAVSLERIRL